MLAFRLEEESHEANWKAKMLQDLPSLQIAQTLHKYIKVNCLALVNMHASSIRAQVLHLARQSQNHCQKPSLTPRDSGDCRKSPIFGSSQGRGHRRKPPVGGVNAHIPWTKSPPRADSASSQWRATESTFQSRNCQQCQ